MPCVGHCAACKQFGVCLFVKSLDLAFELDQQRLAFAIAGFASRYPYPPLTDAVLFDIKALLPIESNADVVFKNGCDMVRTAGVNAEAVRQGWGGSWGVGHGLWGSGLQMAGIVAHFPGGFWGKHLDHVERATPFAAATARAATFVMQQGRFAPPLNLQRQHMFRACSHAPAAASAAAAVNARQAQGVCDLGYRRSFWVKLGHGGCKGRSLRWLRGLNLRNHCGFWLGNIAVKHEMRRHCTRESIQLDGSPLVWPRCQFQACLDGLSQDIGKGLNPGLHAASPTVGNAIPGLQWRRPVVP